MERHEAATSDARERETGSPPCEPSPYIRAVRQPGSNHHSIHPTYCAHRYLRDYPDRTLLLVYPPPGPMARDCLRLYRGRALVYVGEGIGGCNGDDAFFRTLKKEWTVRGVGELDPFPGCFERLYVLERKKEGWRRYGLFGPRTWYDDDAAG